MLKKLAVVFVALCMLLSVTGCKKLEDNNTSSMPSTSEDTEALSNTISLLCCYSDTLNPYTAASEINRNLTRLIFDPLIKLDNSYEPISCLAESVTANGAQYTVRLRSTSFSDGSRVTADDVVYSYNLAKGSPTVYAAQLYEVKSVSAADSMTVVFSLTRTDPYFERLLDFPILKAGSDKRTDIDDVVLPPIGSGRFIPNGDSSALLRNDSYMGTKSSIKEIKLINSPDSSSVSHYVEVGATDYYYTDIADGNIVRMSGQKLDINLNHLIYIGINHSYGQLSSPNMRYALATALNRKDICSTAFYNNALSASGFFPPYFKEANAVQTLQNTNDLQITVENLEKIGYNRLNEVGNRINSSGTPLTFTLMVNQENRSRVLAARLISEQLAEAGITVKVLERTAEQYNAALASGNFQLYLGEVRILGNMDVSSLVLPGGSAAFGVIDSRVTEAVPSEPIITDPAAVDPALQTTTPVTDIINAFYSGNSSISDVAGVLLTEMPVIPVCYRSGLLFCDNSLSSASGSIKASRSDIFLSAEDWICKIKK